MYHKTEYLNGRMFQNDVGKSQKTFLLKFSVFFVLLAEQPTLLQPSSCLRQKLISAVKSRHAAIFWAKLDNAITFLSYFLGAEQHFSNNRNW